jgi:hypothetical protein
MAASVLGKRPSMQAPIPLPSQRLARTGLHWAASASELACWISHLCALCFCIGIARAAAEGRRIRCSWYCCARLTQRATQRARCSMRHARRNPQQTHTMQRCAVVGGCGCGAVGRHCGSLRSLVLNELQGIRCRRPTPAVRCGACSTQHALRRNSHRGGMRRAACKRQPCDAYECARQTPAVRR